MANIDEEWARFEAELATVTANPDEPAGGAPQQQEQQQQQPPPQEARAPPPKLAPPKLAPTPLNPPPLNPPPSAPAAAPSAQASAAQPQHGYQQQQRSYHEQGAPASRGSAYHQQHYAFQQQQQQQQFAYQQQQQAAAAAAAQQQQRLYHNQPQPAQQQQPQQMMMGGGMPPYHHQQQQQMGGSGMPGPSGLGGGRPAAPADPATLRKLKEDLLQQHQDKKKQSKAIVRTAAGQKWVDPSLGEWPDNDHRIFVGDLGNEVNDELLSKTFSKYPSFAKAKVVRDKRTNKSKGFGFVSFLDANDFAKAMREMNGKYIGNRPCKLRKSTWEERAAVPAGGGGGGKRKRQGGGGGGGGQQKGPGAGPTGPKMKNHIPISKKLLQQHQQR